MSLSTCCYLDISKRNQTTLDGPCLFSIRKQTPHATMTEICISTMHPQDIHARGYGDRSDRPPVRQI